MHMKFLLVYGGVLTGIAAVRIPEDEHFAGFFLMVISALLLATSTLKFWDSTDAMSSADHAAKDRTDG